MSAIPPLSTKTTRETQYTYVRLAGLCKFQDVARLFGVTIFKEYSKCTGTVTTILAFGTKYPFSKMAW